MGCEAKRKAIVNDQSHGCVLGATAWDSTKVQSRMYLRDKPVQSRGTIEALADMVDSMHAVDNIPHCVSRLQSSSARAGLLLNRKCGKRSHLMYWLGLQGGVVAGAGVGGHVPGLKSAGASDSCAAARAQPEYE
jgi:hypothetical protein